MESVFARLVPDKLFEIEHVSGHHFVLTIELEEQPGGADRDTLVHWRQAFDSAAHYERIASVVATADQQNLERLAAEVARSGNDAVHAAK